MSEPRPLVPVGGYSPGPAMTEEARAEYDARAEQRRQASIAHGLAVIGQSPEADAMRQAQAAGEQRLATADLRGALRRAQLERRAVALELVDAQDAVERAAAHLAGVQDRLQRLEAGRADAEGEAADRLAASFRRGTAEAAIGEADTGTAAEIATVAAAVGLAQAAHDRLAGEAEALRTRLRQHQHQVGAAVLDVVKGELGRLTVELEETDGRADWLRGSLRAAGLALANERARRGWPAHIFAPRTAAALAGRRSQAAGPPDWSRFILGLYDDPDAELG